MRAWPSSLSLSLSLGLGLPSCHRAAAPVLPSPIAPPPVVDVRAESVAETPQPPPAPASSSAPSSAPVALAPPSAPEATELRVELEPPYSALGHSRLATEMLTLGRDEELFRWALGGSSAPEHLSRLPGYHPATRVVVDVKLLSRAPLGTSRRALALARRNAYWPLRACFENAQRVAEKPSRHARIRLTVGAHGKVLGASHVERAEDPVYARCVLTRLKGLDFAPGFTRKLDLEVDIKQWSGHAPVPPHAPDGAPPLSLSTGDRAALAAPLSKVRECYVAARAKDAELWGRLALRLELQDHDVVQATQVETRFPSAEVVECARQALLGVHLESSGASALTWAIRLSPAQGAPAAPPELAPASLPPEPSPPLGLPPEPSPPAPAPPAP